MVGRLTGAQRGQEGGLDHPLVEVLLELRTEPDHDLGAHGFESGQRRQSKAD
jgi:hypothetical protein